MIGHVIVDAEDVEWASHFHWTLNFYGYAVRRTPRPSGRYIPLHREILGLTSDDARVADHINRNKLDCRRRNLRVVTRAQNNQNRDSYRNGKSRFRGVCWDPRGHWRATAQANGRWTHIGNFASEEAAAKAASDWRREHMPFSTEMATA